MSKEFRQFASSLAITTKAVPVEAHWSVGLVERVHGTLRRAYEVIMADLGADFPKELALQMAVKAVNDTAGPHGLVPTLLVFGAYPRMIELDPPAPSVSQRAKAVRKAMAEITKIRAKRAVNDALNHRNGPNTGPVHDLPLNSEVLVWREGKTSYSGRWDGPYKLLAIEGETCKVQMPSGPTSFRSTVVKPNLRAETNPENGPNADSNSDPGHVTHDLVRPSHDNNNDQEPFTGPEQPVRSYEDSEEDTIVAEVPTDQPIDPPRRKRGRPRKHLVAVNIIRADLSFSFRPGRVDGVRPTQFEDSRRTELNGLLTRGVFEAVHVNTVPPATRKYGTRWVDEVKHAGTDKVFEKSRLVIQVYNDQGKHLILTQSSTIQRVSQRIILVFTAIM